MASQVGQIIQLAEGDDNIDGIVLAEEVDGTMTFVVENNSSNFEIRDLICNRFGFDELILKRVIENGFDIESLLLATDAEINDLFPVPLLGTRAKFKFQLNVWRKNASSELPKNCRDWIQSITPSENKHWTEDKSFTMSPSSSQVSFGNEANYLNNYSLQDLLNKTEKGLGILEFYKKEKFLDENNKTMLISVIVESYLSNLKEMSMKDIESATNAIQSIFPTEEKQYYLHKRGHGLNPTGKLHDKAVNARLKLRSLKRKKDQELAEQVENPISDTIRVGPESQDPLDSDVEQIIIWVMHNNEPWIEVQEKWSKVLSQRQRDIKSGHTNILTKWPLFKHSLGHTLIELDYETLNPNNKSRIFEVWSTFSEKIIPYLKRKIRDKTSLSLLKELDKEIDTNSRDFIIFNLLHALLKPPIVSYGKNKLKKGKWKPSIKDAQDSCFVYCSNGAQYQEKVDLLREKYLSKGLTLQPIIIVIGPEVTKLEMFFTFYDGILYKFSTFIKCFDVTFKLFHVMNFKYPKEGTNFYLFVENYFYDFHKDENANVTSLLSYLNQ